jgi:two-component system, LytTR family, response regulator
LPGKLFPRIHKSYMVSLQKITSIEHQRVYISDAVLPIGDSYKLAFYELIK